MQLGSAITLARTFGQTDLNGLTDSDAIVLGSEALLSVITDLVVRGIDAATVVEAYMNATTTVGIYNWPDGVSAAWVPTLGGTAPTLLLLKTLNVNYIDQTQKNYLEPNIIDPGNLPAGVSYQQLRANASKVNPMLDNRGSSFEIFPAPVSANSDNLTKFFYMLYYQAPTSFVAVTDNLPYPLNINPNVLAWRMAYVQAARGNDEGQARAKTYLGEYGKELDKTENILKKGSQKSLQATGLPLTGYEF